MKNKGLIAIIVLLVIALGVVGGLYLNEKNNKVNENNNYLVGLNNHYQMNMGTSLEMNYSAKLINNVNDDGSNYTDYDFSSFDIVYHYTGENIGKLFISEKEINLNGGIIQDMKIGTNFYDLYFGTLEDGEEYNFVSTLYILFKDGTIGKVSTEDIKSGKYSVTIMEEYKDIVHFVEVGPVDSGADTTLWVVDKDSNVYSIDLISAGT